MPDKKDFKFFYVLAAKGIQDFILRGDKLRLMVGGSELIEGLPNRFLTELARSLGLEKDTDYRVLGTAAGIARLLFLHEDDARKLALHVPLTLSVYAPGLDAVQAVIEVTDNLSLAMKSAEMELQKRRNILFPAYPIPSPLVERCPRSGLPAVGWLRRADTKESADSCMIAKDRAIREARTGLAAKILPDEAKSPDGNLKCRLAEDFEELVSDRETNIALVHIDGNGLGKLILQVLDEIAKHSDAYGLYSKFSESIEAAAVQSIKTALTEIVKESNLGQNPVYPFRSLVCAGDDLTLVLRATDAMGFAQRYLNAFEENSRREFSGLGIKCLKNQALTACAGVAFVKKSFPFAQAYELCESLCRFAKDETERQCSAVAFWRVTSTVARDFRTVLETELKAPGSILTMMPYVTGGSTAGSKRPTVDQLIALKNATSEMPRGSLRGLLSDLYRGFEKGKRGFERICDVAGSREESRGKNSKAALGKLQDALSAITGATSSDALFKPLSREKGAVVTPLHDAMELIAAETR